MALSDDGRSESKDQHGGSFPGDMAYFVYILRLENDHFYVGSTGDLERRLAERRSGSGSKTTADSPSLELLYSESFPHRRPALQREHQLKGWSRAKKLALIAGDPERLKKLARCRTEANGPP